MALLEIMLMGLALITVIIASYTDIKTREIPDWLNYGLIFAALGIRGIFAVTLGWPVFLSGLLGLGAFFILGYVFYYSRQWGGGDSKLLMGMGAIIGISYPWSPDSLSVLWFLVTLLLIGAIYGLCTMTIMAVREWKNLRPHFRQKVKQSKNIQIILAVISLAFVGLTVWQPLFWPLVIVPFGFFYLLTFVHTVEKTCFIKPISIAKLTEGDWLAEKVEVHGKEILEPKTLEKEDLVLLRRLEHEGKLKHVVIKEGIPFAPSFLLGYIVFILKPDWILEMIMKIIQ